MGKSDALSQRSDHASGTEDNRDLTLLTPGLFAIRALEGLQVAGEEKDTLKEIVTAFSSLHSHSVLGKEFL